MKIKLLSWHRINNKDIKSCGVQLYFYLFLILAMFNAIFFFLKVKKTYEKALWRKKIYI